MSNHIANKNFLPEEVSGFLGHFTPRFAQIKTDFRDGKGVFYRGSQLFVVQELHDVSHRCTIGTHTDLPDDLQFEYKLDCSKGTVEYVAVTLVKCQMTTWDAVNELAHMLGIPEEWISTAGLKDRWATTSQRVHIRLGKGLTFEQVVRACCPEELRGRRGFFIKDPRRVSGPLTNGKLVGNHFTIKVLVPGASAQEVREYVDARIQHLSQRGMMFPNAFGKQRLGRRQNLHLVGHTLVTKGAEAAIEQFLCETSPNESSYATEIRLQLAEQWRRAKEESAATGTPVAQLWSYFDIMRGILAPVYKKLNMVVEHMLVEMVLTHCCFNKAISQHKLKNKVSLWFGAYQSFWFNQILAKKLRGEIDVKNSIPLFVDDPQIVKWYRDHGCAEAVPEHVDPTVRELFLAKRGGKGPWRKAFIPVKDYADAVADGVWDVQFLLRSGSYATTFIGLMFDLEGDESEEDALK